MREVLLRIKGGAGRAAPNGAHCSTTTSPPTARDGATPGPPRGLGVQIRFWDPAAEGGILSGTGRENAGLGRFWPLFVGVPLIALLAVAAILLSGGGGGPSQPAPDDRPRASGDGGEKDPKLGTPTLGSADAPVVMTEYSDYQ